MADLNTKTKLPAIPPAPSGPMNAVISAIREVLNIRTGVTGDPLDAAVTFRDMVNSGALTLTYNGQKLTGPATSTDLSGGLQVTSPNQVDYGAPPAPTGLAASGGLGIVFLTWDNPTYANHAYTEIWREQVTFTNGVANPSVIGSAIKVGTSAGYVGQYVDSVGAASDCWYWIRFVSTSNVIGPFNAVAGVRGTASLDPAYVLKVLAGNITLQQLAADLSTPIAKIPIMVDLINGIGAGLINETNSRTTIDSALANSISTLQSAVNGSVATITNKLDVLSTATTATANSISTLQTTVNGNTASIQTQQSSINGLSAQWTVKTDVNGYISGFGLSTTAKNGVPDSAFVVNANNFAVGHGGDTTKYPFIIGNINNVATVGINGALVVDGSITANTIAAKAITANKIDTPDLSAISANMGSIYAGQINFGAYTGWSWPANGGLGLHVSQKGILAGNPGPSPINPQGKYFQLYSDQNAAPIISTNIPAYIEDAQVSTLKISGNAVTVPVGATGYGAAPAVYLTLDQPAPVLVLVMCNWLAYDASVAGGYLNAVCGGNSGTVIGISMGPGASGSATAIGIFNMPAGTHLCTLSQSNAVGGRNLAATSVFAMGIKR